MITENIVNKIKDLEKRENSKYSTENGVKEFKCKDGYIDNIYLEGETLVNMCLPINGAEFWDENRLALDLWANTNHWYSENKQYTVINLSTKKVGIDYGTKGIWSFTRGGQELLPKSSVLVTVNTNECISNIFGLISNGWENTDGSKNEFKQSIIILEGNYTNRNISYFEGIKSVGQGDKIEILTSPISNNLIPQNYIKEEGHWNSYGDAGGVTNDSNWYRILDYIPVKENTKYSGLYTGTQIIYYNSNKDVIYHNQTDLILNYTYFTFTTPKNASYIRISYPKHLENNICIFEGIKNDKKIIPTTLRSLPNGVKDTIEKRGNKYYKIKRCEEIILNGSVNVSYVDSRNGMVFARITGLTLGGTSDEPFKSGVSSLLPVGFNTNATEHCYHDGDSLYLYLNPSKVSSSNIDGVKAYLKSNSSIYVYSLATPVIEELPNFNPQTFEGDTTLIINSGAIQTECDFEVTNSMSSELEVLKNKNSSIEENYLSFIRKYNNEKFIQHYQVGPEGDFNNLRENGFYKIQTTETNLPTGAYRYGMLIVFCYSGDSEQRTVQIYIPNTSNSSSGGIYTRSYNYGLWSAWFKSGTPVSTLSLLEHQISELEIQLLEREV